LSPIQRNPAANYHSKHHLSSPVSGILRLFSDSSREFGGLTAKEPGSSLDRKSQPATTERKLPHILSSTDAPIGNLSPYSSSPRIFNRSSRFLS
jgi:hypothetical protein